MRNACAVTLATLLFTSFAGLFQTAMSGICDDIASGLVINISVPCPHHRRSARIPTAD